MEKLTFNDFKDMEKIDHNIGFNSITPAEICYEQYKKFPDYICVLKHENKIIGYVATLALKREMYEKLKNDKATENDIELEHMDFKNNPSYLYIAAIVIDKPYQNVKNVMTLFKKYKQHMKKLIENGMNIKEVMAECSTDKGLTMAQKLLKMKSYLKTNHGIIHSVDGNVFSSIMLK